MGAHTQQAIKQFLISLVSIPTAIPRITISKLQKHVVPPERGLQAKKQMPSYISRPACWSHVSAVRPVCSRRPHVSSWPSACRSWAIIQKHSLVPRALSK